MRILIVTGSFPPMKCGVGDYTAALAAALAQESGVEVAVLTDREASTRRAREPYRVFPVIEQWSGREFAKVEAAIRQFKPDVVHVQFPTLGYKGLLPFYLPTLLLKTGIPLVQTWHEPFPTNFGPKWRDVLLGLSSGGVVVVRPGYRKSMPWWFRILTAHKRFELIPNAPPIPRASLSDAEREELRTRYLPAGKSLVTFFGFLHEFKGIDDLLLALDPERHQLLLVGPPKLQDPYQVNLLERISQEPLSRFVTHVGFLPPDEVAKVLAASDAVALPYRMGGGIWNTAALAASLQGTFLVTTSIERRGYDAQKHVYYIEPGNSVELRGALEMWIGTRNAGRDEENYPPTWSRVANSHLDFYRRYVRREHELAVPIPATKTVSA